ncbi:hypothetical protein D0867_01374 [Hortaea werneckii]|uniref:Glutaredoxin domain-containing protein n=2 Tax=Hortaea werneckii TaxID=91943 RepID=A0A3M7AAG6_HORWE|nr:hypothetical protein D0867_01374 [Hortaea werneckii]
MAYMNATLRRLPVTAVSQNPLATRRAVQTPKTDFLRSFFGGRSASPNTIMAAKTKAQDIIDNNSVAVFSKSWCPYCKATKSLLSELGAKPYILELDQVDDGADIQDALQEMTNQRSVPNVFINKKHMGGNSDLQAKKGELPQLLKDAKAI